MAHLYLQTVLVILAVVRSSHSYRPAPNEICLHDVCEYDFTISRVQSMTYKTNDGIYDVALNGSNLVVVANTNEPASEDPYKDVIGNVVDKSDVITVDGVQRDVIIINGQFPGPTLEVMEGAQIIVHVYNQLVEVTSIHWHGMHQTGTNFMDGVPYLTQCPILPNQFFTYSFNAEPSGTHWYHSHYALQRFDGLYGALVIHENGSTPESSYSIFASDWYHLDHVAMEVNQYSSGSASIDHFYRQRDVENIELSNMKYYSSLLGGRGRWQNYPFPLNEYILQYGVKQRFRMVHSGAEYIFEIAADNHLMEVVACDGGAIQPLVVDSIILLPGETIDFNIYTKQTIGRYWLRAERIASGFLTHPDREGARAILVYSGTTSQGDPTSVSRNCTADNPCTVFNCPYGNYPNNYYKTCIAMDQAKSNRSKSWIDENFGTGAKAADVEIFLNFAFNTYGSSTINSITFVFPRSILLQNQNNTAYYQPCDEIACAGPNVCSCTHIHSIPFNQTVDMVLTNYEQDVPDNQIFPGHHAIHLHGHNFAVLKTGFPPQNSTTGFRNGNNPDVMCTSNVCNQAAWTNGRPNYDHVQPAIKDTVVVPAQGYTVIRFRSNNPGLWFLHCHMDLHTFFGMGMIIDEAHDLHPLIPPNFPTCVDFNGTMSSPPPPWANSTTSYANST